MPSQATGWCLKGPDGLVPQTFSASSQVDVLAKAAPLLEPTEAQPPYRVVHVKLEEIGE